MSMFRIRPQAKNPLEWIEVEAISAAEAIQDHHAQNLSAPWSHMVRLEENGKRQDVYFASYEIDGAENLVSRMYRSGIYRRGGVRPHGHMSLAQRLVEVAQKIEWKNDPMQLIEPGWDGEETEWR